METLTLPQQQLDPALSHVNDAFVADSIVQMESQFAPEAAGRVESTTQTQTFDSEAAMETFQSLILMAMRWKNQEAAQAFYERAAIGMAATSAAAGHIAMLEQQRLLDTTEENDEEDEE